MIRSSQMRGEAHIHLGTSAFTEDAKGLPELDRPRGMTQETLLLFDESEIP
jgi:hypothetical protein